MTSAALAAAVVSGMLVGPSAQAVVGVPAQDGDFGFTARIVVGEHDRACSGALVASQWLITAASCFADDPETGQVSAGKPKWPTTATIGRSDLTGTAGQVRQVVELVPREGRDVVMARLDAPTTGITPVQFATTAPAAGEELQAAGYGRTQDEWAPTKLHTAAFGVDAVADTTVQISGKSAGDAICAGDTGGPIVRTKDGRTELVGIASRSWQGGCFGVEESRTGAVSSRTDDIAGWIDNTVNKPSTTDFNNDGVDDVGVLYNYGTAEDGRGHTGLWTFSSTGTGFAGPVKKWDNIADTGSSWTWSNSKPVHGDFNGDGRDDVAVLYDNGKQADGSNRTTLWTFTSTGDDFANPVRVWDSASDTGSSWTWASSKPVAGDFNGDGKDDVAVLYDNGKQSDGRYKTALWTFTSTGNGFVNPVKKWDSHSDTSSSWTWDRSKPVVGDHNGDGKDDVAVLYDNGEQADGSNRTALWTFTSTGDDFANPVRVWDSTSDFGSSWTWANSKPMAGDFNGDGKDDLSVLYDNGTAEDGRRHTTLWTFTSSGSGFGKPVKDWDNIADTGSSWTWASSKPVAGDFNGDGKDDVAVLYDNGKQSDGRYKTALWTFTSTGTGFVNPVKDWDNIAGSAGSWTWASINAV